MKTTVIFNDNGQELQEIIEHFLVLLYTESI